jgi:hypothetical protein
MYTELVKTGNKIKKLQSEGHKGKKGDNEKRIL